MASSPLGRSYGSATAPDGRAARLGGGGSEAPHVGVYRCVARAGATAEADVNSKMVRVHEDGETVEITVRTFSPSDEIEGYHLGLYD